MTLRVKLEIVPFGREEEAREIGRLDINNIGNCEYWQHFGNRCLYNVIMIEHDKNSAGMFKQSVKHFRSDGPWDLLHSVLDDLEIWRFK